jgi:urease accessory protein
VRAAARIVAVADGRGGTRLAVLHGEAPLLPRRTGPAGPGPATVHLVGGAAGPLGGDDLDLAVSVGPDARLRLRSVAATVALPARGGAESRLTIRVDVARGGELDWQPEPLVAAAGCRHRTLSIVDIEAGGRLIWREELVCGRHEEPSGNAVIGMIVRYAGRALYANELAVGPSANGWAGPAVLGGARASGTLLRVDPDTAAAGNAAADPTAAPTAASHTHAVHRTAVASAIAPAAGARDFGAGSATATSAVLALPGPALLAAATGPDIPDVRAAIDAMIRPLDP